MAEWKKMTDITITSILIVIGTLGFSHSAETFDLRQLKNYTEREASISIGACSSSSVKAYEDYRMITDETSAQYQYIANEMRVDGKTGFLINKRGFIGVAMGYQFGAIGSEYYIELDTGIVIPVVKVDEKARKDAPNGCSAVRDGSVIEFVIDADRAMNYFGSDNGYVSNGNFNNYEFLNGGIADIRRVDAED